MIINVSGIWDDVAAKHTTYLKAVLSVGFARLDSRPKPEERYELGVRAFLNTNLTSLLDPAKTDFSGVIDDFNAHFPTGSDGREKALDLLKEIFDYKSFADKNSRGWNAYTLCEGARWKVCPYCHLNGIETALPSSEVRGYRPDLDHFLSQSDYPYLALSLGNLVPSCAQCNRTMKGAADFHLVPHLHPQRDTECIRFLLLAADNASADSPEFRAFRRGPEEYKIALVIPTGEQKVAESLRTFQLNDRYQVTVRRAHWLARNSLRRGWREMVLQAVGVRLRAEAYLPFDPNSDEYRSEREGKLLLDVFSQARSV